MSTKYDDYVARGKKAHGDKFSAKTLDKRFVPYFESGARIRVDFGDGVIQQGTVGVTGGWRPVFLLMLRSDSVGSSWTLGKNDTIVGVQKGKRYYPPNGTA